MKAWYLGLTADQATEDVILVGDRSRALRAADLIDGPHVANVDRGLTTVLGSWKGLPVTVCAFGMGAPIAAITLHELAALGGKRFVRAGTMMVRGIPTGTFIVAERALVHEGTSRTYGVTGSSVVLDRRLVDAAMSVVPLSSSRVGTIASCDGYYTQMTDLLQSRFEGHELDELWDSNAVIGIDMETSALANVARTLDVEFGSVCLGTVDTEGPTIMHPTSRSEMEENLIEIALDTLIALQKGAEK